MREKIAGKFDFRRDLRLQIGAMGLLGLIAAEKQGGLGARSRELEEMGQEAGRHLAGSWRGPAI